MAESKKNIFNTLRFWITVYILAGAVVFSGIIIYAISHYLNNTLEASLINQGRIVGKSISDLAAEKIVEGDAVGLKKLLEEYRYYLNNEYLMILDEEQRILADTYNGIVPEELKNMRDYDIAAGDDYSVEIVKVTGNDVYDINLPIKEGFLGFVRVGLKKSDVDEQIGSTLLYIGSVIALGTLLAIAAALIFITFQVTRPVIQLANSAREISLGNFDTSVKVNVKNELQILASAIERMKESLRTSLDRLKARSTIGRI